VGLLVDTFELELTASLSNLVPERLPLKRLTNPLPLRCHALLFVRFE